MMAGVATGRLSRLVFDAGILRYFYCFYTSRRQVTRSSISLYMIEWQRLFDRV